MKAKRHCKRKGETAQKEKEERGRKRRKAGSGAGADEKAEEGWRRVERVWTDAALGT